MKTPKPGRFYTINGVVYRVKKRTSLSCEGCALNNVFLCPNVVDMKNGHKEFDCANNNILFVKV